jgi:RNA polymerase sigma-70 factor (ECF subfamily)
MPDDWEEILSRDGGAVWRTAYRILRDRADAEECFQEAFLAALEFSRRNEVQHWRGLLLRLVTARAVDRLRRRRRQSARQQAADWDSLPDHAPTPFQTAQDAELSECLRTVLGRIPPKQAEVFCLHCLEGWSYREIAQQLAVSLDSVGVLLHRARKRLRQLLSVSFEDPRFAGCDPASNSGPQNSRKEPS